MYAEVVQHFGHYSNKGDLLQRIRLYSDADVEKNQIIEVVHELPVIRPNTESFQNNDRFFNRADILQCRQWHGNARESNISNASDLKKLCAMVVNR